MVLPSGLGFIILFHLSFLALETGLEELYIYLNILSFSILSFWTVNILTGKLFLGDTGSIFIGLIACLSHRNSK